MTHAQWIWNSTNKLQGYENSVFLLDRPMGVIITEKSIKGVKNGYLCWISDVWQYNCRKIRLSVFLLNR